jgi:DNA-binding GntR family transcriptional regulator
MLAQKSRHDQSAPRVYADILHKIVNGQIPSGQRLGEERLAGEYGESRTPVREALFALERDGLVKRVHNCGATVMPFTPDDVEQIYEIRKSLECLGLRRAAPSLALTELYELEQRLVAVGRERGRRLQKLQLETDLDLHRLIVSRSGNSRLIAYLDNLSLLLYSLRLVSLLEDGHARQSAQQHLGIVRALIGRDAGTAERLLAEHLDCGMHHVLAACFRGYRARPVPTNGNGRQ